jgi:hypothetical protein
MRPNASQSPSHQALAVEYVAILGPIAFHVSNGAEDRSGWQSATASDAPSGQPGRGRRAAVAAATPRLQRSAVRQVGEAGVLHAGSDLRRARRLALDPWGCKRCGGFEVV